VSKSFEVTIGESENGSPNPFDSFALLAGSVRVEDIDRRVAVVAVGSAHLCL
jgi:hypothetical protein